MLQPPNGPPFENAVIPIQSTPIYIQLQGFVQVNEVGNLHFTNQKFNGFVSFSSVAQTLYKTAVGDTVVYFATALIPYDADTLNVLMQSRVPGGEDEDVPGVVIVKPPTPPVPKGDEFSVTLVYPQFTA